MRSTFGAQRSTFGMERDGVMLNQDKKPSILRMKNEWTTYSSIGVQRKILKQNTEIIKNFMNSLSVPSWYRGVSVFQKKSADQLLNAIRDDCAQRTVYRTMRCLESIGLDPLPSKKQLQTILPLCGGSDLALLWFLMEWLYRDNKSDSYSVNEQLIMSSIAHLDMNTTLRELDRILPPGQPTITEMAHKTRSSATKKLNRKKIHDAIVLPYFEKLPYPRPKKSRYIGIKENRRAILDHYPHQFIDSSHTMSNESHRWFQSYNIDDKEGTVRNFAKEEITSLLNNFEAAMVDKNNVQTMCRQHEDIDYLRNSFDAELDDIVKKIVQEAGYIFDRKHQSYKRIISRLQCDIKKCRHEFYTMAENWRKHCDLKLLVNKPTANNINIDPTLCLTLHGYHSKQQSTDSTCPIGNRNICGNQCKFSKSKSLPQNCSLLELRDKYAYSSKSSENDLEPKYFIACQEQRPFKFNYCKIFSCKKNDHKDSDITPIYDLSKQFQMERSSSEEFSKCVHKVWQQEFTKHKVTEFKNTAEDNSCRNIVDYGLDYYDPEDDELMDRMLKDALEIMKKNHKFVFASIPAAHRFPMLREWIRLRYGKTYRRDELIKSFQKSLPIFTALAKVGLPVEKPSNADMGRDLITNYSCRDYVLRKSNYIRNEYYKRIDKAILAQSRVIYFAMRSFLCCKGPPRNTIFAYMPAHKRENYHFRPWKPEECIKRKQVKYFLPWKLHR